jgi:hypothetical protein
MTVGRYVMSKARQVKRASKKTEAKPEPAVKWPESENGLPLCTTSRGVTLECQAVLMGLSNIEQRIKDSIDWPDAPTYVAHFGGEGEEGDDVEMVYNVDSIQGAPDEDQQRWTDYLVKLGEAQAELEERLSSARVKFFALEGVRIISGAPSVDEWAERQEFMTGVEVPENPLERQVQYFADVCIGNMAEDLINLYIGVSMASGADRDRLTALEDMFQSKLAEAQSRAWGVALELGQGDSGSKRGDGVDGEHAMDAGLSESGGAHDTEPVETDEHS